MTPESKTLVKAVGSPVSRRRLLLAAASVGIAAPLNSLLAGCGSGKGNLIVPSGNNGGGGGTSGLSRSTGQVVLPPGSSVAIGSTRLVSGYGTATLSGDGHFTVHQPTNDAALLVLADYSDQPLLMGFSGSTSTGMVGEVSAVQTAIALVFYALGAFTLPAEDQEKVRAFLANDDRVKTLGVQIATILASNPLALAQSDPALTGAVTTLRDSLFPVGKAARSGNALPSLRSRDEVAATLISVNPGDEVAGLRAAPNADGLGLTITNSRRRNAFLYIYQTSYLDQDNQSHQPVDHRAIDGNVVWATSGLAGVVGSLVDYLNGTVAYGAVTSGPYSLDLFPAGRATRSEYNIDLIGNGSSSIPLDVATEHPEYEAAFAKICFITFIKDLVLPAIATIVGFQSSLKFDFNAVTGVPGTELLKAFDDIAVILSGVVDSSVAISQSNVRSLLVAVLKGIGNNGTLRQKFIEWLVRYFVRQGAVEGLAGIVAGAFATALNAIVIVVDKLLGGADLGAVIADWGRSESFVRFDAKVIAPKVQISPASGTMNPGDSITLNAVTSADATLITYHWTITSGNGSLKNPVSDQTGTSLDSSSKSVLYLSDVSAKDGDKITVQMEAFLGGVNDPNRKSIGKAQSFLTVETKKDAPLTVTDQVFKDFTGSTTSAGTAAICSTFPIDSKAKSYTVTIKAAGSSGRTVRIQQSDIGDSYPDGADFYPPKQYETPFTGVSGFTDYEKFYHVGNTITVPHSNVSWGPGWSTPTREDAIQNILKNWPIWQYSLEVVAHY